MYAAGILPVTRFADGRTMFLLGKDARDATWSDFGGKCERVDRNDPMNTATREFYEETLGCVVAPWGLRARMTPGNCVTLRGETKNGHPYWMYVIEVPFVRNADKLFSKFVAFLKHKNASIAAELVEKTEIRWMDFSELMAVPKRPAFRTTVMRHQGAIARVSSEPWKSVCEDFIPDATKRFGTSPR